MDVICVSVLGENFPSGTTFCPQNFSFLPTSHGLKATFKLRSPAKARKFQISLPASAARRSKTSFSAALPHVNFMWEFLHQHGARWPLRRAYEFSPILVATCGGSLVAPFSPRLVKSSRFMLPIWCPPFRVTPQLG